MPSIKGQVGKMCQREILFKIQIGVGGHEYVIYANGEIEGFSDAPAQIVNYHQALVKRAVLADRLQRSGEKLMEKPL